MKKRWMRKLPVVLLIVAAAITSLSAVTMLLWNNILSPVFHIGLLTFWQAAGILVLSRLLFGGLRRRHHHMGMCGRRGMWMKWRNMTPEQREQMRQMAYSYCCGHTNTKQSPAAE